MTVSLPPRLDEEGRIVTSTEDVTAKSVNYTGLIPLLLQAIQEQQAQIEALTAEVHALKAQ